MEAREVWVLDCLLWGRNAVSKSCKYSEYSILSWFIPQESLLLYSTDMVPTLLKLQCESTGQQPAFSRSVLCALAGDYCKLLPEPRTAGLPVNVQSHLSMARHTAGPGSGEGHSCSFAGLTKALSFCWLNAFSGAGVRYWGMVRQHLLLYQHLQSGWYIKPSRYWFIDTHTDMLLYCTLLCVTYCILIYFIIFQIEVFQVGTRDPPVGLAQHWTMY